MRKLFLLLVIVAMYQFVFSGCDNGYKNKNAQDGQIVATIGNYKMTVEDFKDGVDFMLTYKYLDVDSEEAKKEILDELITKKILLQEAQRQDLDKEKAFMKEIEKYWEQSLLKLLFERKSKDILENIDVGEVEIRNEYRQMKRRIFAELIILNDEVAAKKISQATHDNFDIVKEEFKTNIIFGNSPEWWTKGDLPPYLEKPLFSLNIGEISSPIKSGANWAIIKVLEEETNPEILPLTEMASEIKQNIQKRKKEEAIKEWIKNLRKKTSIKINKKVLDGIKLE